MTTETVGSVAAEAPAAARRGRPRKTATPAEGRVDAEGGTLPTEEAVQQQADQMLANTDVTVNGEEAAISVIGGAGAITVKRFAADLGLDENTVRWLLDSDEGFRQSFQEYLELTRQLDEFQAAGKAGDVPLVEEVARSKEATPPTDGAPEAALLEP